MIFNGSSPRTAKERRGSDRSTSQSRAGAGGQAVVPDAKLIRLEVERTGLAAISARMI
jgi:hypothetical protein